MAHIDIVWPRRHGYLIYPDAQRHTKLVHREFLFDEIAASGLRRNLLDQGAVPATQRLVFRSAFPRRPLAYADGSR
jgi:hypothetical protein